MTQHKLTEMIHSTPLTITNPRTDGETVEEFDEDTAGKRYITTTTGQKFVAVSDMQFGLWTVKPAKGGHTPAQLQGRFTSISEAEKAIHNYIRNR